jgi:hypothetical protein
MTLSRGLTVRTWTVSKDNARFFVIFRDLVGEKVF